jgi:predicted phosphodiesterase
MDQASSPRLLFAGDSHSRFEYIVDCAQQLKPTPVAIILLGDQEAQRPLDVELAGILSSIEVWWIHGNHDTDEDSYFDNLFGSGLAHKNLHGRVVEIAGLRVAGLGGIFRKQVWMPREDLNVAAHYSSPEEYLHHCGKGNRWRRGLPRKHRSSIFKSELQALSKQRADILVTHEAPSANSMGFLAIDELARAMGVKHTFHGHLHESIAYRSAGYSFSAFGVGFREIADLAGNVVWNEHGRV